MERLAARWVEAETPLLPGTCLETHFCGVPAAGPRKGRFSALRLSFPRCDLGITKGLSSREQRRVVHVRSCVAQNWGRNPTRGPRKP